LLIPSKKKIVAYKRKQIVLCFSYPENCYESFQFWFYLKILRYTHYFLLLFWGMRQVLFNLKTRLLPFLPPHRTLCFKIGSINSMAM